MDKNISNILKELYELDPELKKKEKELVKLITAMTLNRPETGFDVNFARKLKSQLLGAEKQSHSNFIFQFNFMKKAYLGLGVAMVALAAIAIVAVVYQNEIQLPKGEMIFQNGITRLPAGAFGSLGSLSTNTSGTGNSTESTGAAKTMSSAVAYGRGGGGGGVASQGMIADSKIVPPYEYTKLKYIYKGEEVKLEKDKMEVFKRLKGGINYSSMTSLIKGMNLGLLDLKKFQNAKVQNINIIEDRDLGYNISVDFRENNIFISENWDKWRDPERESCQSTECFDKYRIKIENVPADEEIISLANKFMKDKGIDISKYGDPIVNNDWRRDYEKYEEKNNFYIPEVITVTYPMKINDIEIKDQSGNPHGIFVSVNIGKMAVTGASNIRPANFESSEYTTENDWNRVLDAAISGGYNKQYDPEGGTAKFVEIGLGTPTLDYIVIYDYSKGTSEETFIPAMVFPVQSETTQTYWVPKNIIVPLPKEMLDNLLKGGTIGPGIQPIIMQKAQ